MTDLEQIVAALRALAARPDNDFTYSWWDTAEEVLAELDGITQDGLSTLFLPTSGMQELAISSGTAASAAHRASGCSGRPRQDATTSQRRTPSPDSNGSATPLTSPASKLAA